jgi:hypothetical protein
MGENKHIKEIDAFAKKYVKEIKIESPSIDFTANLMSSIALLQPEKSKLVYKPLISSKMWFVVLASVIAIVWIPFKNSEKGLFTLPEINFSFLEKINFSGTFESLQVSNTTMYVALLFSVFMAVQIIYLKRFFEKRINS